MDEITQLNLKVVDDKGIITIDVGLTATLYFKDSQTAATRAAVSECFTRFVSRAQQELVWVQHPGVGHFWRISDGRVPSVPEWFKTLDPDKEWEFNYRAGNSPDDASALSVEAYGSRPDDGDLSYFKFSLPLTWFASHAGHFLDETLEYCELLKPLHGYGGLGVLESSNRMIRQRYAPLVYDLAQRFSGLEVDSPILHTIYLVNGIKGVNWLTILGDYWIGQLGGLGCLTPKLSTGFKLVPYDGGLVIQAGGRPQLGDNRVDRKPPLYAELSSLLKPVRIRVHRAFQNAGPGVRFDRANSEKWLARFD